MKNLRKAVITITLFCLCIICALVIWKYYLVNIARVYIENTYGLKTTYADMQRVGDPTNIGQTDILLRTVNMPQADIFVRINYDGNVVSDDFYYYLLESKLQEYSNKILADIWNSRYEVSVKVYSVSESENDLFTLLTGKSSKNYYRRMNTELDDELQDIMKNKKVNVSIADIKKCLPKYSITLRIMSDNKILWDDEYRRIYSFTDHFKQNKLSPDSIYIDYINNDNSICNFSISHIESIENIQDIQNAIVNE